MCHIVRICHFFGGLIGFLIHFVSHHSYLCGLKWCRESSHTNPFRKIPDSRFASIYVFQTIFYQICWAWAIIRRKIKSDITDRQTDNKLIWGGLGNLRFLQVNGANYHGIRALAIAGPTIHVTWGNPYWELEVSTSIIAFYSHPQNHENISISDA